MNTKINPLVLLIASGVLLSCTFAQSLVSPPDTLPTSATTPSVLALTEPPIECTNLALTPEECANTGTHEYSTSMQILFDQSGQTCQLDNTDNTVTVTFLSRNIFRYTDSYDVELEFTRKDDNVNVYEAEYMQPDGIFEWKYTITFTPRGFTMEAESYELEKNEQLCTFLVEQQIIAGQEQ